MDDNRGEKNSNETRNSRFLYFIVGAGVTEGQGLVGKLSRRFFSAKGWCVFFGRCISNTVWYMCTRYRLSPFVSVCSF